MVLVVGAGTAAGAGVGAVSRITPLDGIVTGPEEAAGASTKSFRSRIGSFTIPDCTAGGELTGMGSDAAGTDGAVFIEVGVGADIRAWGRTDTTDVDVGAGVGAGVEATEEVVDASSSCGEDAVEVTLRVTESLPEELTVAESSTLEILLTEVVVELVAEEVPTTPAAVAPSQMAQEPH